jgi:hypothetical protein
VVGVKRLEAKEEKAKRLEEDELGEKLNFTKYFACTQLN